MLNDYSIKKALIENNRVFLFAVDKATMEGKKALDQFKEVVNNLVMNMDFDTKDAVFGIIGTRSAPEFIQAGDYDFNHFKFNLRYYVHPSIYVRFKYQAEPKTFRKWIKHKLQKKIVKLNSYRKLDKLMGT